MAQQPTLTPAYGRDYESSKDVKEAYLSGKDFIYSLIGSPYRGKYCSCRDFPDQRVKLRYNKLTQAVFCTYDD